MGSWPKKPFVPFLLGAADITVDDIVVDGDPDSFRPAAVQRIAAGDDANNVALAAGQPLPLNLKLDPKGASAPKGTISVDFLDLREKSVGKVDVPVDWATVKDAALSVPITFPLQSRHSSGDRRNKDVTAALGKGASLPEQFQNEARGLGGEVSLVAEPIGAKIDGVVISPRVSDMSLGLEFSTAGLSPGKSYVIEGDVSKSGRSVKTFKSEPFKADRSTVKITIPWPDAELWDLGKPNLYDLDARLVVGGKAVDAMWPERFGFREVKFEGRLVTINGNPVNLFMPMPSDLVGNLGVAESMERNHLNFLSDNHHNVYAGPGSPASVLASDHYALCSEAGFGSDLGVSSISLRKYLVNFYAAKGGSLLDDPVYWESFQRVIDAIHITHYAGFMPIQEFIESDEYWLKYGTKPYMITEQAAPFSTDWTTGSRLGHNSPSRFDVVAERAAALKGDAAFHRQPVDQDALNQFEMRCAGIRKADPNSKNTMTPPLGPLYAYERNSTAPSVYHDVNYELALEQWLNWREEGLGVGKARSPGWRAAVRSNPRQASGSKQG